MKKTALLIVVCIFIFSSNLSAQNLSIGLHSGFLATAFEEQVKTSYGIPVGGYFGIQASENVELGAEFSLLALPFSVDEGIPYDISQTALGGYLRYYIPLETAVPYIRLGAGYYMGTRENTDSNQIDDFKGAFGFNAGLGLGTESGLYFEFIFHFVTRELDGLGIKAAANNLGGHIGYAFSIN